MTNGDVLLPDYLFADARLYPVGGKQDMYLSKVTKSDTQIIFYVSDSSTDDIASGTVEISTIDTLATLGLQDKYGRDAGVIVTDENRLTPILGWTTGDQVFTSEMTDFVASVVTPLPSDGVTGVTSLGGTSILNNDVLLVGGVGVRLSVDNTNSAEPVVIVHATGEPLFKRVLCEDTPFVPQCMLKTINGNRADEYGNYYIGICGIDSTQTVLRVIPEGNGLKIYAVGK